MTADRCFVNDSRLGRARKLEALLLLATSAAIGWLTASACGQEKKPPEIPQIKVTDRELPFEHKLVLGKGKAARLTLPNGKDVAFWCHGGHPLFDDAALALGWAEKPFQRLEITWRALPDGGSVATGWKSYIRQGGVKTFLGSHAERELFVDKYRIVLKDEGDVNGALPVTIRVRLATEKEMLFGDAEREHYLKQLKSDSAAKRLAAVDELCKMSRLGSTYAGEPKEIIAAIRPLANDRDPKVKAAAENCLFTLGDEQSLLRLVTPEPKGKWRTRGAAGQIAYSCVRHKSAAVSKQVLTFFQSKDEDLLAFAVTFFAEVQNPASKPQMLAALKHKSPEIRAAAIPAIRFLCKPEEAAKHMVSLLHDPSKQVVLAALLEASWLNRWIPAVEITRLLKEKDRGNPPDGSPCP